MPSTRRERKREKEKERKRRRIKPEKHGKLPKVNEKTNKSDFIPYKAKIVKAVKWKQDFPLAGGWGWVVVSGKFKEKPE